MRRQFDVVVENVWIRPDGKVLTGRPAAIRTPAFLPEWMIRVEGWALVQRQRDSLRVRFDPRVIGAAALRCLLDTVGDAAAGAFRQVLVDYHLLDERRQVAAGSILGACSSIARIFESVQHMEAARSMLFQVKTDRVETAALDLADRRLLARLEPRMRAFIAAWRDGKTLGPLLEAIGEFAEHLSVFRLEDGDPRVEALGGSLIFGAPNAAGARLADILPASQVTASRARMTGAILTQQPMFCRHRADTYDVVVVTVPVRDGPRTVAVTMSELAGGRAGVPAPAASPLGDDQHLVAAAGVAGLHR